MSLPIFNTGDPDPYVGVLEEGARRLLKENDTLRNNGRAFIVALIRHFGTDLITIPRSAINQALDYRLIVFEVPETHSLGFSVQKIDLVAEAEAENEPRQGAAHIHPLDMFK